MPNRFGNRRVISMAAVLMASAFVPPSFAASPSDVPKHGKSHLEEITVEGHRESLRRDLSHFVEHVTRPDFLDRSLARWLQPVCPAALGLPREQGEYVLARVSTIADTAQAPLAKDSDCRPNLFIVFTHDPRAYMLDTQKKFPFIFRNGGRGSIDLASTTRVNDFLDTKIPVRVWYNTSPADDRDHPDIPSMFATSDGRIVSGRSRVPIASPMLWYGLVEGFDNVFVVVDTSLTQGMKLTTIVDYAAMVGLMELQPGARVGDAPSILAAFSGGTGRAASMTDWDGAFLSGLYGTEQQFRGQRGLIVDRMMAQVSR